MSKSFSFRLSKKPKTLLKDARNLAVHSGVEFSGGIGSGRFSGRGIAGAYKVSRNKITLTVNEKPFFVPWSIVEKALREFFA